MKTIVHQLSSIALMLVISGCGQLPGSGFTRSEIEQAQRKTGLEGIQIVDVNEVVASEIAAKRKNSLFSESLNSYDLNAQLIGAGDVLEIVIWEAPPASLFGSGALEPRTGSTTARGMTLPEQMVTVQGDISVPFAGKIAAAGRSLEQIEQDIALRLKAKANQPQVMIRVLRNASKTVTVVGDVNTSTRLPLTPKGERLLDALAAAGGVRQPVGKVTIQVTRGSSFHSLPLETIIRDPKQNVPLQPGDVVAAMFQPLSLTVLGATGKNDEISFESQGISLAQALARSGGLIDARADAKGLFIFRLESPVATNWPKQPVAITPDGLVPVIYRIDLDNPSSFFAAQNFQMQNKDLLYVSNAPVAEMQKFLNLLFSIYYPLLSAANLPK
jgi:polysaccharide export outer membrane protein